MVPVLFCTCSYVCKFAETEAKSFMQPVTLKKLLNIRNWLFPLRKQWLDTWPAVPGLSTVTHAEVMDFRRTVEEQGHNYFSFSGSFDNLITE